jgi:hypothetical protein
MLYNDPVAKKIKPSKKSPKIEGPEPARGASGPRMTPPRMKPRPNTLATQSAALRKRQASVLGGMGLDDEDPLMMDGLGPSEDGRIAQWLDESILPRNQEQLVLQLLHHSSSGGGIVQEWRADDFENTDSMSIATEIYGQAVDDANEQTSVSRYMITALDNTGRQFGRFIFRVTPKELQQGAGNGETEDPGTPQGHLSQAYRHSEVFARMMAGTALQTQRLNMELVRENRAIRADATRRQVEMIDLFEKMKDRKMMRDVMWGKHIRKERMASMAFNSAVGAIMKFGPDLAKRLGFVTEDEQSQMQTIDATTNWLAAMPEAQIKTMIANAGTDKERQLLEKAWVSSKKRAAGTAAKAALTGAIAKQMSTGEAATSTSAQPAQGAQPAAESGTIRLAKDEIKLLNSATAMIMNVVATLDGMALDVVMGRIPEEAHEAVKQLREDTRRFADMTSEEQSAYKKALMELRGVVVQMLITLSEQEISMITSQMPENYRDTINKVHKIVHERVGAKAA